MFDGIANPTPSLPPGLALDLGVDADHLPEPVQERTAGVAVVDRGVGLDRVVDREVVRRRHLPVERADDAARHGSLEPERAADRDAPGRRPRPCSSRRARAGRSSEAGALTLITARSVDGSLPTSFALYVAPFQNLTEIELAPSTTCSFVTMSPFSS